MDQTLAMIIQENAVDWPGVGIEIQPIRDYPTGFLTASMIGFLGPIPALQEEEFKAKGLEPNRDKVGYAGLELQYQDLLAGVNGKRTVEVDVAGKQLRTLGEPVASQPGMNLRLTLDTRLQQAATAIMEREINFWNTYLQDIRSTSGVVIAMNPKTGEILAMVSYPTYENNRMARLIPAYYYNQLIQDPANPLLNHAVGDVLPAGSVFKLTTAVGALNEGVVTPEQVIETPGRSSSPKNSTPTILATRASLSTGTEPALGSSISWAELPTPAMSISTSWAAAIKMKCPKVWVFAAWAPTPAPWAMEKLPGSACQKKRKGWCLTRSGSASTRARAGRLETPISPV